MEDEYLDSYMEDLMSGPEPYEDDLQAWEDEQVFQDREGEEEYEEDLDPDWPDFYVI